MTKCKTCQHAIKLHKHPSNRMFNGAISEQVDFLGCVANGKDNGVIVDRVVKECEGWMKNPKFNKTIVAELKKRIGFGDKFSCGFMVCNDCVFDIVGNCGGLGNIYDFAAIAAHDFDKTEVTIDDLEQFKIK